jgi:hypothetical protein
MVYEKVGGWLYEVELLEGGLKLIREDKDIRCIAGKVDKILAAWKVEQYVDSVLELSRYEIDRLNSELIDGLYLGVTLIDKTDPMRPRSDAPNSIASLVIRASKYISAFEYLMAKHTFELSGVDIIKMTLEFGYIEPTIWRLQPSKHYREIALDNILYVISRIGRVDMLYAIHKAYPDLFSQSIPVLCFSDSIINDDWRMIEAIGKLDICENRKLRGYARMYNATECVRVLTEIIDIVT